MSATIMKITYGFDVKDKNDGWVSLAAGTAYGFAIGGDIGRFTVNFLPIRASPLSSLFYNV